MSNTVKRMNEQTEIITLDVDFNSGEPPKAVCSCGWETKPNPKLMELGVAAREHEENNIGHIRRKH